MGDDQIGISGTITRSVGEMWKCPKCGRAFKKHIGLYPGGEATSEFAERLAGYKTSKGAIQLPLGKLIDYELITDIVRWRIKRKAKGSDTL